MTIIDTDALSRFLRALEPWRTLVAQELAAGTAATTAVNSFELLSWRASPRTEAKIGALLDALSIVEVDDAASRRAAAARRHLEERGQPLAAPDLLVAGVCLARGLPLLTSNQRHFARVPGLVLSKLA